MKPLTIQGDTKLNSYLGHQKPIKFNDYMKKIHGDTKNSHFFNMRNLGKGQIFGVEDVMNLRKYTFDVKCISETAEVFEIKAPEFLARFSKDDKTWKYL